MNKRHVYFFGGGKADGKADMKAFLGGKGANLAEMTNLGIPVPPGFTISTEACDIYYKNNQSHPKEIVDQVEEDLKQLEDLMGKKLGDEKDPLLVSVRSGAAVSMPGMMDTVLNLGLTDKAVQGLINKSGNERFAWDAYRRFIQMFGDVVRGVPRDHFEEAIEQIKEEKGVELDTELDTADLKKLVATYKEIYKNHTKEDFPQDPKQQLWDSINAVFGSWNNPRAIKYRQMNRIQGLLGTAVNVQSMVFGNFGEDSGTGVCFTRDPSTGENYFYGEFLMNAQGEDVVAGIRTPKGLQELKDINPEAFKQLEEIRHNLEKHYHDMQDIEFTIQQGKLYILQTRNGKRTIFSWLRTQVEMVEEGLVDEETAVSRVPASEFGKLFAPILDSDDIAQKGAKAITRGLNASPGGACGKVAFTADKAELMAREGEKVILVRIETSPEDIGGMGVSQGILTARGGMTSHAAVVARGMGCPCVSGAGKLKIDYKKKVMSCNGASVKEGDIIAIDGFSGEVFANEINVKPSEIVQVLNGKMKSEDSLLYKDYAKFMGWVDKRRKLKVRCNADTGHDTEMGIKFGAEGIGLCRTEHMFFEGKRIISMRKMILAKNPVERKAALDELLPMQKEDFVEIFTALNGRPGTIRLLDPPLHEFLPHDHTGRHEVALQLGISAEEVSAKVNSLHEFNPMLGFRGCRLAVIYPEILQMQVRAIMEAALEVQDKGIKVYPEIMVPLVGEVKELAYCKQYALQTIEEVFKESGKKIDYKIGTMIEVPRAAITADEIAKEAEFFSFGTNDLTQMTCGFSRDDSGSFLGNYVNDIDKEFYGDDPFQVLDQSGVGKLVKMAVEAGRQTTPDLKMGICGEHGGDPKTVKFCRNIGLNYVSCSPFRVAIARLAAAQAEIEAK